MTFSNIKNKKAKCSQITIHNTRMLNGWIPRIHFFNLQMFNFQMLEFSNIHISNFQFPNFDCRFFILWGPNLLLGRTSFSANLFLGAYCIMGEYNKYIALLREKVAQGSEEFKAVVEPQLGTTFTKSRRAKHPCLKVFGREVGIRVFWQSWFDCYNFQW